MNNLADSFRRYLEAGQQAGHPAGQEVSHRPLGVPALRDTSNPQKSANLPQVSRCHVPIEQDSGTVLPKSGTPDRTPAGTAGQVDERIAVARLREWHARLSKVDEFTPPPGWTLNQWLKTVDAALWVYETYGSKAVRDGWSALDLFGVDLARPGEGGLADRLGDKRVLVMAADAASWRSWGCSKICLRGRGAGLVPLWEASR